ncbi:MAG: hypothetical protein WCD37_02930 [Chloroflexia bacterium]
MLLELLTDMAVLYESLNSLTALFVSAEPGAVLLSCLPYLFGYEPCFSTDCNGHPPSDIDEVIAFDNACMAIAFSYFESYKAHG